MPERIKPTRSWLFTPGTRPDRFSRAREVGADVLIIDLEDAVSPVDKPSARRTAIDYLCGDADPEIGHALRINGLDTYHGIADVEALLGSVASPDFIVLPKTESDGHMLILDRLLAAANKPARLIAIIESVRGVVALDAIAASTPRLAGIMLGAADMAADLGAATEWDPLAQVRGAIVMACAGAGVMPIDSPYFDIHDTEGLTAEMARAKRLGFVAKAAIHPAQVHPINTALTPTGTEIDKAKRILAANDKGVGVVDGEMIDEAVARKARRILAASRP